MSYVEIDQFDYAYSPLENKDISSQRILNPDIKLKINIFGKRIIKKENKHEIIKIHRSQKIK
jgi:hypothetical protein